MVTDGNLIARYTPNHLVIKLTLGTRTADHPRKRMKNLQNLNVNSILQQLNM